MSRPLVEMQGTTLGANSEEMDRLRLRYGFWIIISGFALVFLITLIATFRWAEVTSVATVVGAVASLVGTVVGAFLGVQVGAVGKERAEAARERSEEGIKAALSMLAPEAAEQLREQMNRWERRLEPPMRYMPSGPNFGVFLFHALLG